MERIAVVMGKMHSGGKKNLVMEYYRHIDRSRIQFDFICDTDSNAIPVEEIESLGGRVYQVTRYQQILQNMRDIKAICKENHYKIIHAYNGTMNLFPMYVGWRCGIPIRITESISMAHSADRKTVIKNILRPFSHLFVTHYMSNGEACGRWQFGDRTFDDGKVRVFKTVINTEVNRYNEELRQNTRRAFNLTDNIVIGHIGRLTEQKNTLFLIDIFRAIAEKEPKARLMIIGHGNLEKAMLERVRQYGIMDRVLYLGRREDIQQFYNAMDCFLLPSFYEDLPVVGVEAENCGLPVFFSTEIPEESSACKDLGTFIPLDKSPEEWADIILEKTRQNMPHRTGHENEVRAAGFDSATGARELLKYYEELLAEAGM